MDHPEAGSRWYHGQHEYRVTIAELPDFSEVVMKDANDAHWSGAVAYTVDDENDGESPPKLRVRPLKDFLAKFTEVTGE